MYLVRQPTFVRHHWVHRRRQDGKCRHCGKVRLRPSKLALVPATPALPRVARPSLTAGRVLGPLSLSAVPAQSQNAQVPGQSGRAGRKASSSESSVSGLLGSCEQALQEAWRLFPSLVQPMHIEGPLGASIAHSSPGFTDLS